MKVRFGVFADLHVDLIHDGVERMERFLNVCRAEKVDFCVELGDFCPPGESNAADKEKILYTNAKKLLGLEIRRNL